MFTLGESQSERHILRKEKIPRRQNNESERSKNKESEIFKQDKLFENLPAMQRLDHSNQPSR